MAAPKKKPLVRLEDVASDAEVSVATVSLALRNDPSISEETRRRVLEAQKRLGYRPIRKRTPSVPLMGANEPNVCKRIVYCIVDFPIRKIQYSDFLNGVISACRARKIRLELKSIQASDPHFEQEVFEKEADGIILTGELNRSVVDRIYQLNPNTLILGNYAFTDLNRVELDVNGTASEIGQRMVTEGHRQFAHLIRDPLNHYERQMLMSLRDRIELEGLELPREHVFHVKNLYDSIVDIAEKILSSEPPITAFSADSANVAEACLAEIRHQIKPGRPLPTAYAASITSEEWSSSGLTILDMGPERAGWLAVERVSQMRRQPFPFAFGTVVQPVGWKEAAPAPSECE